MKKEGRILLIGPRTNLQKELVGGATTSFEQLITFLGEEKIDFKIINTQKYFGFLQKLKNAVHVIISVFSKLTKCDLIFLNASQGGIKNLAPIVFIIARIFGKRSVLRPFGGNFGEYTSKFTGITKWLFFKTIPYSDLIFLQTKALVRQFENRGWKVAWLPTSRSAVASVEKLTPKKFTGKFIYAGNMHPDKGINEILAVFEELGADYTIHFYGPMQDSNPEMPSRHSDLYKGVLSNEELRAKLSDYDVLLLPTYYAGEGYPGIIIEAYVAGLPVITTNWRNIPEIVEDGKSGILIEPRSVEQLKNAVLSFNSTNYETFANYAQQLFYRNFESKKVLQELLEQIFPLLKK